MQQQVAKIGGVERAQPVLIGRIERLGLAIGEIRIIRRRHPVRRNAAIFPALDDRHQRRGREAFGVHPLGFHHLLQQAELVVGIEDVEAAGEPDQLRMAAQHAGAERVEGAEP